ncbi:MAG TPA: penicillin-binding protein [Verrucomicrobiales bacterium]|nr:penicillin-binding protein [Verrucomicrobiales bacterium]
MKAPVPAVFVLLAPFLAASQTIEIKPAVMVGFDPSPGKTYAIETTSNFSEWSAATPALVGQSERVGRFFVSDAAQRFFRVAQSDVIDLAADLTPIRSTHNLPALGCAVVMSNRIVGLGVVGVRKHGVTEAATVHDHWHHGSMTKSMTAALAALLVDEGLITWTAKLVDLFPEHAATRHAGWGTVTLEMLLTNSGGAPGDLGPSGIWTQLWNHPGTPHEQRLFLTQEVTKLAPRFTPGTGYEYSNAGFAMAGAMLEKVTGRTWEQLLSERLFAPLGMATGGFGVPATPRHIDHPWGHTFSGATPSPIAPGTSADNPPGIGPAGTVNCSLIDFARYAAFQLAGARGENTLLQPASHQKLFTPANASYAMGWIVADRSWGGGTVYNHTGSNTQWFTNVWIAPNRNWAVVVVTNIGGNAAFTATDAVVGAMIAKFIP